MLFTSQKTPQDSSSSAFSKFLKLDITRPFLILSYLLISFLAGVLGGLIVNNYYNVKQTADYQKLPTKILPKVSTKEIEAKQVNQSLASSLVGIYFAKSLNPDLINNTYSSFDLKGSGVILTNDGWIMTSRKVVEANQIAKYVVITQDGHLFPLDRAVLDKGTDIVFVKIKSEVKIENLSSIIFADSSELVAGDDLFSLNSKSYVATAKILNSLNYYFEGKEQLVQTSEKFSKIILLAGKGFDLSFIGAPSFNLKGEAVGIAANIDNDEIGLIPVNYFKDKIDQLLKTGEIKRNYLGINYLDLGSTFVFDKRAAGLTQGALVAKYKSSPAVIKNSPADKAGIKENDIILAVENDPITKFNSLTELIQQYKEGSLVNLKIKRQDKVINLSVQLATN